MERHATALKPCVISARGGRGPIGRGPCLGDGRGCLEPRASHGTTTGKDSWEDTVMRRNSFKLTAMAALALVGGGALGMNCSKSTNPNSGDVKLAVVLPSGSTLTTINYKILSSTSAQLAAGSFNVSDPHATVSLDIVVPVTAAGNPGDTVNLTATSSTGESCTGTSAPFPVLAGANPAVTMTLSCGTGSAAGQTGNIGITATLVEGDNCPSITSAVVGPDETSVGGSAMVIATASDP